MQIKQILVIAAIVLLTAFAVKSYNDYQEFEALRSELMVGQCEMRDTYKVCTQVTDIYVGPVR
jgi:hypothetical protein